MKKIILGILLIFNSFRALIIAQPPSLPADPGIGGSHAPVGALLNIGDTFTLLIVFSLLYGSYRYYRFYREHLRINKT